MGLGGTASYYCEVTARQDVSEAVDWAKTNNLPMLMVGGGSNIVWRDEGFPGLIIVNRIAGFTTYDEDELNTYVTIGAGENWDSVVARTVELGLSGIEALSIIPGTAGATPVQNVGAYGQEISDTLATLEAFDSQSNSFVTLRGSECGFSYRTSRFKTNDRGRYIILSLTLHLFRTNPMPPFYPAVQAYFDANGITSYTPATVREAVVAIRSAKLPDPAVVHNNGSFFANPIVDTAILTQLRADHGDLPNWPLEDGRVKISAAWLIERAGFKGYQDTETGMATWPAQPLVLVNEHAKTTADLLAFKQKIVSTVQERFGILLEQEPELLP